MENVGVNCKFLVDTVSFTSLVNRAAIESGDMLWRNRDSTAVIAEYMTDQVNRVDHTSPHVSIMMAARFAIKRGFEDALEARGFETRIVDSTMQVQLDNNMVCTVPMPAWYS